MDVLTGIEKPGRYTGGELGSIVKQQADVRFALCFPDVYEIGMSHVGMQILYEVLNRMEGVAAERSFCPWPDRIAQLEETGMHLSSLETARPLHDFDMVGFSLSYELSYSNVLTMLELGGIPLLAAQRTEQMPLVVGGGQCTTNPEPVADFFDLFVIGEAEEAIEELVLQYRRSRSGNEDRSTFLRRAAQIPGVYVPALYEPSYREDGTMEAIRAETGVPQTVVRRYVEDFEHAAAVTRPIVPYLSTVHDRCVLEIMRGCPNGCRFCQAGYITRPVRERSADTCMDIARKAIAASGYEEIGLCSLSSGDHSQIVPLIGSLLDAYRDQHVSVSLPSLRMDSFRFSEQTQEVRKKGLTFAPEAGTQRLRDVINKNITEEDILQAAQEAFRAGATHIKLYFMIGLPTETTDDLDGIHDLVAKIRDLFYSIPKSERTGRLEIVVSVSNFVPKAATPFQWEAQDSVETFGEKHRYLKDKLRMKGVKYQYHDAGTSFLEAVFARGDRRLAAVLLEAHDRGAMFDSWHEFFSLDRYMAAFDACGIDPGFYANRVRQLGETLPYAHIDSGISEEFLVRELGKAKRTQLTPSCTKACSACGLERGTCPLQRARMEAR